MTLCTTTAMKPEGPYANSTCNVTIALAFNVVLNFNLELRILNLELRIINGTEAHHSMVT